jgi:hypothetical protein
LKEFQTLANAWGIVLELVWSHWDEPQYLPELHVFQLLVCTGPVERKSRSLPLCWPAVFT